MSSSIPERIGRYEVVERLGSGGMGVVYLARDPILRRIVAVKVLPGENEDLRERFAREARSAASLRHNNIVTIYDVGEDNGQPYIAMEFLDGESMAEMIRRRAPVSLARRLQLIIQLCAGLGYAHRNGIIHRDIKPANLMITTDEGLKILDFGLARVVAEPTLGGLTRVGMLLGTPHYLSPEQIAGQTVDQASDIFAVGLVLYELVSYQKAFPGDSQPVILFDIVQKEPTPIRQFVPDIDDELEGVVKRAVEKDRDRRYPNLDVLAEALDNIRMRTARPEEDSAWSRRLRRSAGAGTGISSSTAPANDESNQYLDAIALKRAAQIAQHLVAAADQLQGGHFNAALEHCEQALMLDPEDQRALDTLRRAQRAQEDSQVQGWIEEARAHLQRGAVTEAEALIEQSLRVRSNQPEALSLQHDLREQRREREQQAERRRSADAAMARANRNMEKGALEAAIRSASEALAQDPAHAQARELRARALAMVEERERQHQLEQAPREIAEKTRDDAERLRLAGQERERQAGEAIAFERHRAAETQRVEVKARQEDEEHARSRTDQGRQRAVDTAIEPLNVDAREFPAATPQPLTIQHNAYLLVLAAAVLLAISVVAWLTPPRRGPTPTPAAAGAQAANPAEGQRLAQQNAERYRRLLAQADDRLAAQDPEGAMAAIQEAEKTLAGDSRVEELKKQVESVRAAAQQREQQRADVERALDEAAKLTSHSEAMARLQRELARYPDHTAITDALGERTKARDTRIADLVRLAQRAPDAQAVPLLQEALTHDSSRLDVRRELQRRQAALIAASRVPPRTRDEIETDVRRTLYAYQSAYASRSVDAFLKVAPFRTRAQVENEFKTFRSIQLNIESITISLDESGTRAVVECTISSFSVPADPGNSRPVTRKRVWQFQLASTGGGWQITSADPR